MARSGASQETDARRHEVGGTLCLSGAVVGVERPGGQRRPIVRHHHHHHHHCGQHLLTPIHARIPVVLPREIEGLWLDPGVDDPGALAGVLTPYPAGAMEAYEVSALVNSVANDGPEVIEAAGPWPAPSAQIAPRERRSNAFTRARYPLPADHPTLRQYQKLVEALRPTLSKTCGTAAQPQVAGSRRLPPAWLRGCPSESPHAETPCGHPATARSGDSLPVPPALPPLRPRTGSSGDHACPRPPSQPPAWG